MEFFGETSERYVGQYKNDLRDGHGDAYYSDGSLKYSGKWKKGQPHGSGTAYVKVYHKQSRSLAIQKVDGTFVNGIYNQQLKGPQNKEISDVPLHTSSGSGNAFFENAKRLGISAYQKIIYFLKPLLQQILNLI